MNVQDAVVLVTPRSFGTADLTLRTRLEEAVREVRYVPGPHLDPVASRQLVQGVHGWIAGLDVIDATVLEAADELRVIARYGVGIDRIDQKAASRRGVTVRNTPNANTNAVAEHAVGLVLAAARGIVPANAAVRDGMWTAPVGVGLAGATVGLIGLGAIGSRAASILRAFDANVLAFDPYVAVPPPGVELVELEDIARRCEILSLHAPLTDDTFGMIDTAFLSKLPTGAILVNTARGELIDENAVVAALQSGRLRAVALDTLREEPPPPTHPLLATSALLTPHMAARTNEAVDAMGRESLEACLACLASDPSPQQSNRTEEAQR